MARLTRAQQQDRTRATVVLAARREFAEHGYAEAKVDRIAERAELTRGAVYSNFSGKRALYLAVLADAAEVARDAAEAPSVAPTSVGRALGELARVWLERLPLVGDSAATGHLQLRSLSGVLHDELRAAMAGLVQFEALLLGLALETVHPTGPRRVRTADLALTLLHGAVRLAEDAPGAGDPFDLVRAAEHLATTALGDDPVPPHLALVEPARWADDSWSPPHGLTDEISGRPADLGRDGVIVVLGPRRLAAAEEAVRAARRRDEVTVVIVTDDPDESGRLARLRIADLVGCLRRVFRPDDLSCPRVVLDTGVVASALGADDIDDDTELAVRVQGGRIAARSNGRGAAHAAATASGHPRA